MWTSLYRDTIVNQAVPYINTICRACGVGCRISTQFVVHHYTIIFTVMDAKVLDLLSILHHIYKYAMNNQAYQSALCALLLIFYSDLKQQ